MVIEKSPSIPGFTALSDQVFLREPSSSSSTDDATAANGAPHDPSHPDTVAVYGWGDGIPKHVVKYTDGLRVLFPHARQIIVLSPISKGLSSTLEQRTEFMQPALKALFPPSPPSSSREESREATLAAHRSSKVFVHVMSNMGAINAAATWNAYVLEYGAPMPMQLLSMDSTPGSTDLTLDNAIRWGRAMAYGVAKFFPWPFVVTQTLAGIYISLNRSWEIIMGREAAGAWSRKAANDETYMGKATRRLYMYSKEDDLILWKDIESHVAEARELGWEADVEVFEGTGHVGHLRKHPEQYWSAIQESWKRAVAASQ